MRISSILPAWTTRETAEDIRAAITRFSSENNIPTMHWVEHHLGLMEINIKILNNVDPNYIFRLGEVVSLVNPRPFGWVNPSEPVSEDWPKPNSPYNRPSKHN